MTSWRVIANPEDDVMAGYKFPCDREQKIFPKVLKIDMNQFKSIWGLMFGIKLSVCPAQEGPGYTYDNS